MRLLLPKEVFWAGSATAGVMTVAADQEAYFENTNLSRKVCCRSSPDGPFAPARGCRTVHGQMDEQQEKGRLATDHRQDGLSY